jgi:hypothetical protein
MFPYIRGLLPYIRGLLPYIRGLLLYIRGLLPYIRGLLPYIRGLLPYIRGLLPYIAKSQYFAKNGYPINCNMSVLMTWIHWLYLGLHSIEICFFLQMFKTRKHCCVTTDSHHTSEVNYTCNSLPYIIYHYDSCIHRKSLKGNMNGVCSISSNTISWIWCS